MPSKEYEELLERIKRLEAEKENTIPRSEVELLKKDYEERLEAKEETKNLIIQAVEKRAEDAEKRLEAYSGLERFFTQMVDDKIELLKPEPTPPPSPPPEGGESLTVEQVLPTIEVLVNRREKVTPDESTLRGQLALLMAEAELDKPSTLRSIIAKLRDYGFKDIKVSELQEEVGWFLRGRFISRNTAGYYQVRDKSRITQREADG